MTQKRFTCLTLSQTSPCFFFRVCSTSLLKTLWEKEKLLVTSNFSFLPQCFLPFWRSHHHFHQIKKLSSANSFSLVESKNLSFGQEFKRMDGLPGLAPFQTMFSKAFLLCIFNNCNGVVKDL